MNATDPPRGDAAADVTPRPPANPPAARPGDRGHIAQQELIRRDLPESQVADALDDFDGDEN